MNMSEASSFERLARLGYKAVARLDDSYPRELDRASRIRLLEEHLAEGYEFIGEEVYPEPEVTVRGYYLQKSDAVVVSMIQHRRGKEEEEYYYFPLREGETPKELWKDITSF